MKNAFMLLLVLGSLAIVAQGDKPSGLPEDMCIFTTSCFNIRPRCYRCLTDPNPLHGLFWTMTECLQKCPSSLATTASLPSV
ncbi:hypothetical protein GUJ93_ZPchr0010g9376 [Zizania palustris]|uniref:Uncharacterized protein n=1 Tax=Zizania palustris TaxID=103762 RepID=A0A8J6BGW4_ZIZPA|nr:hypothetical protein GUJ93_ZPchr0010g9376 [Zizania palustris]